VKDFRLSEILTKLLGADSLLVGTLLPFLIVLTVIIFVHEMGHYLVGRWCGIGVKAFSIGFGPEIFGFNDKHGTRWRLAAIPLGGYVKFAGDMTGAGQMDQAALDAMTDDEKRRAFHLQPVWKRAATVFAGPFANFLLTILIFSVFFGLYGKTVADPIIDSVVPNSVAEKAGFKPGDRFISVDGQQIVTFVDVQRYVSQRPDEMLTFKVDRSGSEIEIKAAPIRQESQDAFGNKVMVPILGVKLANSEATFRRIALSPTQAVGAAVSDTMYMIGATGRVFARLATGREDKCQLGGPVKIATMAGQAAKQGIDWLISLAAMLSLGVGILNLLPIPPLDGGHLLLYGMEAGMRRPVPAKMQDMVFRVGTLIVLSFMGFVVFNDLFAC
jgi:regulator of sigma E protease